MLILIPCTVGSSAKWNINAGTTAASGIPAGLAFMERYSAVGTSLAANRLVLREGGNVGIGTDNPTSKLTANGDVRCSNLVVDPAYDITLKGNSLASKITTYDTTVSNTSGLTPSTLSFQNDFRKGNDYDQSNIPQGASTHNWAHCFYVQPLGDLPDPNPT